MGEAKPDTQRGWGKERVKADRGSRERGVQWAREGARRRDSSLGAGRQRAEEEMEWEWEAREADTRDSLRGIPRGQKPAPTEIHRYPAWERGSQRHPEKQLTGQAPETLSPAKRAVSRMEGAGRQEERIVPWQVIASHRSGEVVLSENGHLMVCRACDRYVM